MDKPVTHFRYVLVPESLEHQQTDLGSALRSHVVVLNRQLVEQIHDGIEPDELRRILQIEHGFGLDGVHLLNTYEIPDSLERALRKCGVDILPRCSLSDAFRTVWRCLNLPHSPNAYIAA